MIRIFKDNDIKVVTQGVYNSLYKPLGYKPIIEEKPKVVVKEEKVVEPKENKVVELEETKIIKPKETKESSKPKRKRGE